MYFSNEDHGVLIYSAQICNVPGTLAWLCNYNIHSAFQLVIVDDEPKIGKVLLTWNLPRYLPKSGLVG